MEDYIQESGVGEQVKKDDNISFIILRMVFVLLIALSIIGVRYLSSGLYQELKGYYDNYVSVNITAEYYLSEVE